MHSNNQTQDRRSPDADDDVLPPTTVEDELLEDEFLDDEPTSFERFSWWLNRHQWFPLILFGAGLVLFIFDVTLALQLIGAAIIAAGLYPVITGMYRGPFGTLRGWKARARGLVSVGIGLFILAIA